MKEEASVRKLFTGLDNVAMPTMTTQDVLALRMLSQTVTMSGTIENLLVAIRRACEQAQILVSDRKWCQIVQVVKACAVLAGRLAIEEEDLVILNHVLWSDPTQIPEVKKLIAKLVNPVSQKILEITDGVAGLRTDEGVNETIETFKKLKHAAAALAKLGDPAKNKKLADAITEVEAKKAIVSAKVMA